MPTPPKVFIVGGTGAQGRPIVHSLVKDNAYSVLILTRNASSPQAKALLALSPKVSLLEGSFANEDTLRAGYRGCDYASVNIDGFNTGEKTEIYWAMRAYEIALQEGIRFFVYGNLDFGLKKGGWEEKYRCGHYDGKGRVGERILLQNKTFEGRMGAALFTTGPYIEMCIAAFTPMTPTVAEGVVTWKVPLGKGAVPHVALEDCGVYVRWLFDHQDEANGMDLEVAIAHIGYAKLAAAFEKVTGRKARYIDMGMEEYWESGVFASQKGRITGYNANKDDPAHMTQKDNFTGFWNLWRDSGYNEGVVKRDYALLDRIHPERIKSVVYEGG